MAHRDIKPANIFIDGKDNYKLGDFGSACFVSGVVEYIGDGTSDFLSPEMRELMLGEEVEVDYFQSDIFSLGVTMLCLAKLTMSSSIPSSYKDPRELKQAVEAETSGLAYSKDFLKLLRKMLESEAAQRLTIEHLFMFSIDNEAVDAATPKEETTADVLRRWLEHLKKQADRGKFNIQNQLAFAYYCYIYNRGDEYEGILKEILLSVDNAFEEDEITLYKAVLWSDLCIL